MPSPKVAQKPPDLAALQQMTGAGGPLIVEIARYAGPSSPYEHIHRADGLDPQGVLQLQPWLYDFAGGGRYRFRVYTPNPGVQPFEWEQNLPGTPRPPAPIAAADAQARSNSPPPMMGISPQGFATAPQASSMMMGGPQVQLPPGYSAYQQQPQQQQQWPQQPQMLMVPMGGMPMGGYGYPPPQAQNNEAAELRRTLDAKDAELRRFMEAKSAEIAAMQRSMDEDRHRREIDALRHELGGGKESETQRRLQEALTKLSDGQQGGGVMQAMGTMVQSALQSITASSTAAIAASSNQKESPYVELLTKHFVEQGSSRALGDMAKVSSEVMANAMGMMAEVAQMAQSGADEGRTRNMMSQVFKTLGDLSQKIVPMLTGKGATAEPQQPQQQQQFLPAANGTDGQHVASWPPPVAQTINLGVLNPWMEALKKTIATGTMPPEQAATAVADLLWRVHAWQQDSGDLVPALARDPQGTARKLLGYPPEDWFQAFMKAIRPAAEQVGFTPTILMEYWSRGRGGAVPQPQPMQPQQPQPQPVQDEADTVAAPSAADK